MTSVCLVCLTVTENMKSLSETMFSTYEDNTVQLREALNVVLNKKVIECDQYPSNICTVCISFLKLTYNFKKQCESSQRLLNEILGNINDDNVSLLYNPIERLEETDQVNNIQTSNGTNLEHPSYGEQVHSGLISQEKRTNLVHETEKNVAAEKDKVPVELLVKGVPYSLNDVVIVESKRQEDTSDTFSGFLRNLGTEISAKFVSKSSYRFQVPRHNEELSVIINNTTNNINEAPETINNINEAPEEFVETNENDIVSAGGDLSEDKPPVRQNEPEIPLLHKCDVCSKVYKKKKALSHHVYSVHKLNRTPICCEQCGHVAQSRQHLSAHRQRHKPPRHACTTCDKRYRTRAELAVHENTHSRRRQFLCSVCGRRFLYPVALRYHMRLHNGERPHACPHCPKTFVVASGLIRHKRIHTGERPYKCQYCEKAFAGSGEYKIHVMGHTGRCVYRCTYCEQGFRISTSLKQHLLGHPGPHRCALCSKTFIEINFLRIHMWYTHRDSMDGESVAPKMDYSPYRVTESEVTENMC